MWNPLISSGPSYSCSHSQSCNGCIDIIKDICTAYQGPNLVNTGINQNDTFRVVITKIDTLFAIQAAKNANILAILNDINSRLNVLELENGTPGGGNHSPYTLL